jgi:mannose-6-phosphate isomerase-like protein (cupin superfamily)
MRTIFLGLFCLLGSTLFAQQIDVRAMEPDSVYENVCSKKIYSDSLTTTFVIWIKHSVPKHMHAEHTEQVIVLEGHANMLLGDNWISVSPGQHISIPMGTPHAVQVNAGEILKVISIQSPEFDGSDRIKLE